MRYRTSLASLALSLALAVPAAAQSGPAASPSGVSSPATTYYPLYGVSGGIVVPAGRLGEDHTAGYGLEGFVEFAVPNQPYALRGEGIFQRFALKSGRAGKDVSLFSIQAHPVTNVAGGEISPATEREVAHEYHVVPDRGMYLETVADLLREAREDFDARALVLSLGYDIVAGDPHGSWEFGPEIFADLGRLLAASELPICVVQEGGYALELLAECAESFASGLLDDSPHLALQVPARDFQRQIGNGRIQ